MVDLATAAKLGSPSQGPFEQELVENLSRNDVPFTDFFVPSKRDLEHGALWRADPHTLDPGEAGKDVFLVKARGLEDSDCPGADSVPADLVSGEIGSVHKKGPKPGSGEFGGGKRACGTGTHHADVEGVFHLGGPVSFFSDPEKLPGALVRFVRPEPL